MKKKKMKNKTLLCSHSLATISKNPAQLFSKGQIPSNLLNSLLPQLPISSNASKENP
jgi:hypothetical protein